MTSAEDPTAPDQPKLKRLGLILSYLVHQAPRRPGRTMLQKLTYLADVESQRRHGHTLTGLDYVAYDHGPWLRELYDALQLAEGVQERRYLWPSGSGYDYVTDGVDRDFAALTAEEKDLLDSVLSRWGRSTLNAVLRHVYS